MEYMKKEASKKKSGKSFLFIGIVGIIIGLVIIAGFIFISKDEIKKALSDLNSFKSKQDSGEGELGSVSPLSEDEAENKTTSTGGSNGAGGGSGGDGAGETSVNKSAIGVLSIDNIIDIPYTSSDYRIVHYPGTTEGYNDDYDGWYYPMFNPSGKASKIVSIVDSTELDVDSRPTTSMSTVYLELSLISQNGQPITISSNNELRVSLPLAESYGYDFGNKTITITINGINYNAREVSVIPLPDLNGTYNSGEVYETITVSFS